ncbi:MAG: ATPase domain-containing protein, partial [Rubrivivax sp.]|nr:ATPase domain-containing protein [Rubrivivax sp.]
MPGLDEVLGGGLPEFSFNLIAGQPGSGKTTLAHQIMFALATPERPAIYFTVLGEPPLKMLRYQQQFDFFDNTLVNRSVRFINLSEDAMTGDLDRVLTRIAAEVSTHSPGLVFVDSFRSVVFASDNGAGPRNSLQMFVQQLGILMTSWQATTFLIGEYFNETDANPVFTVADGLIWLRQSVQRNSMVRKMEVMKMRGQPTLPGLRTFRIDHTGVRVFAPAKVVAAGLPAPDTPVQAGRARMGVPALDEMLGGGLPRGYSLLVAGPSGSGKSILAASFLAEGARCGEAGVLAAFEQHPNRSRNPVLVDLIASGQVGLIDSREPDLSIDEIVLLILTEVKRLKATRIVLDSLSGFELALAPTFRTDFRESLLGLVTTLARAGVSMLMTSELEDRYTDLRFSPFGSAFLADAIVVQRYIEIEGQFKRAISVIKVRGSAHSKDIR